MKKTDAFDNLLLEFAARLLKVEPSGIGPEIDRVLKVAGEFCHMDQILLAELPDENGKMRIIHSYAAEGMPEPSIAYAADLPWLVERIKGGLSVVVSSLPDDLPSNADAEQRFAAKEHVKSFLAFPYVVGNAARGTLVFNSIRAERPWPEEFIRKVYQFGHVLAGALERKQSFERIDEFQRFERLLSEVSAKYINLSVEEIEHVASQDFGRLAALLGVDRCALHLFEEEPTDWKSMPNKELIAKWLNQLVWWCDEDKTDIENQLELMRKEPEIFSCLSRVLEQWKRGECHQWKFDHELPEDAKELKKLSALLKIKSAAVVPVFMAQSPIGVIVAATSQEHRAWPEYMIPRLRLFGEVFANAFVRRRSEVALREGFFELKHLKERYEADYTYLREETDIEQDFQDIVGVSDLIKSTFIKAKQVAPMDVTVLILGETGTGKGLLAQAIHNAGRNKMRPLIQVNCAALSPALIESELFGHEKGAFTGAQGRKIGRFELANGTTLFLDEIGELSPEIQAKLLRVLQDGEFERVGGTTTIKTDARIIAATNRDLGKEVEAGRFRRDLWYRLNVFPIQVPPLRERAEDIPVFVDFFIKKYEPLVGKRFNSVSAKSIKALHGYTWPGNIRELENLVERAVITSTSKILNIETPEGLDAGVSSRGWVLEEVEKAHIIRALEKTGWVINGPAGAAALLGLDPGTLRFRMKKLGISRPAPAKNARRNPVKHFRNRLTGFAFPKNSGLHKN